MKFNVQGCESGRIQSEKPNVTASELPKRARAWFGFDLDGTLAHYEGWGDGSIGAPIKPLIRRMKHYLNQGRRVAVVTARVHPTQADPGGESLKIRAFLEQALGSMRLAERVEIRFDKDRHMIALFDDRAEQVIPNKGILVKEELRRAVIALKQIAGSARGEPYGTHAALAAREALDSLDEWSLALASK
jgi:hypothetical protein